jgi:hypothetical protein
VQQQTMRELVGDVAGSTAMATGILPYTPYYGTADATPQHQHRRGERPPGGEDRPGCGAHGVEGVGQVDVPPPSCERHLDMSLGL